MRIFFASQMSSLKQLASISNKFNILISYEYYKDNYLPIIHELTDKYFIFDSGAFSVWKSNSSIDIDKYISKINELHKSLGDKLIAINLDVIPGKFGIKPTPEEVKLSCEASYKNYLYIKSKTKCKLMPVFHQHDNFEWLDIYIKDDCFLLGISPANDCTTKQRILWLDQVFSKVKLQKRCHGLAATAIPIMSRYPFYSCDSASWLLSSAFGITLFFNPRTCKMETVHYKDKLSVIKKNAVRIVDGFNTPEQDKKKTQYIERQKESVRSFLKAENYLNKLWQARGVKWND